MIPALKLKNNGNTAPVRIRWYSVRQVPFCRLVLNRPGRYIKNSVKELTVVSNHVIIAK